MADFSAPWTCQFSPVYDFDSDTSPDNLGLIKTTTLSLDSATLPFTELHKRPWWPLPQLDICGCSFAMVTRPQRFARQLANLANHSQDNTLPQQ
jgi:hypothetical protein